MTKEVTLFENSPNNKQQDDSITLKQLLKVENQYCRGNCLQDEKLTSIVGIYIYIYNMYMYIKYKDLSI